MGYGRVYTVLTLRRADDIFMVLDNALTINLSIGSFRFYNSYLLEQNQLLGH